MVAAVLFGTAFAPAAEAGALDEPCGDVTLVFARGSGDGLGDSEATKYFQSVKDRLGPGIGVTSYELGTEEQGGAKYKAVGISGSLQSYKNLLEADASWTGGLGGQYRASVSGGVTELRSYLSERASRCSDEVFAVGGYSQGAQVVGDALPGLSSAVRDRIGFVALFGDPKLYLPEGRGPFPPACRGKEFSRWRRGSVSCWTDGGILESRRPYLPSDVEDRTGSWCDRNDGICNNNLTDLANKDHSQYADDGAEIDEAAREIAMALRDRLPDKADEIDVSIFIFGLGTAGLDIAFVIDTTGSMAGSIDAARSIAETAGEAIVGVRGRVALTEYRDFGDPVVSQIVTPLTTDIESFRFGLDSLFASGGGDAPEALLHALMTTLDGLDWKFGATKAAVVLTDAEYHDPDLAGGYTLADVVARSLEIDPVNVFPVVPSYASSFYEPLAEQTAGQVMIDEGDTAAALLEAVGEIETRPVALLASAEYIATPGEEILFDASASYDIDSKLTSFEWDFDGDGVFDEETSAPSVLHAYTEPYDGLIEVRVNSEDGGVANAVASVLVDEQGLADSLLSAPRELRATWVPEGDGDRRVRLDWDMPEEGGSVEGWAIFDGEGQLLGRRNAGVTNFEIADVPLDPHTFGVAAVNQYGSGPSASVQVPAEAPAGRSQGASPPPPRRTAPAILRLSLSRKRFLAASIGPSITTGRRQAGVGTSVVYRLSAAARVRFTVKSRGRVLGGFGDAGEAGRNMVRFSGRTGGRTLAPGPYRLVGRVVGSGSPPSSRQTGFIVLGSGERP